MLILRRKAGESILIEDGEYVIEISILAIEGENRVKIGIDAAEPHFSIVRKELLEKGNGKDVTSRFNDRARGRKGVAGRRHYGEALD